MSDLLKRIANYFANEYDGDDKTAPKMELSVYDLRYIASMNVDRCRAEAELRELKNKKYSRTNADRIRSMSDEELADYIFGVSVHEKPCVLCSDDCDFCELTDEECKNRTLEWLQSEVEV